MINHWTSRRSPQPIHTGKTTVSRIAGSGHVFLIRLLWPHGRLLPPGNGRFRRWGGRCDHEILVITLSCQGHVLLVNAYSEISAGCDIVPIARFPGGHCTGIDSRP